MADVLKVGLIGAGMVSEHHLAGWRDVDGAAVVAIADPNVAAARARAEAFAVRGVYASAAEMIDAEALDAIDIVTPVRTHADLVVLAANRGLATMCQKPLCETAEAGEALLRSLPPGSRLKVHENWRFRPEYRQVWEVIRRGGLGRIERVELDCASSGLIRDEYGRYPALVRQPFLATAPRLVVFELLIHHLDLLTWLFGPLEIRRAELSRACADVIGEDTAVLDLASEQGVPIRLAGSFCRRAAPRVPADELTITAERGRLEFAGGVLHVESGVTEIEFHPFDRSYAASYRGAITDFVEAIATGRPFETEGAEHLAILRLVEDVYRIART